MRTGVSLISFGLVVERIRAQVSAAGGSGTSGVGLAVLGCITLVMGTLQFPRLGALALFSHRSVRPVSEKTTSWQFVNKRPCKLGAGSDRTQERGA